MNEMITLNTATQSPAYLVNRLVWWGGCLLIALACFGFLMTAHAAPDGGVGNGSTAEGTGALSSLTSGSYNTAMGLQALFSNTTGIYNTGTGVNALYKNTGGAYNTADGGFALFSNTTGNSNTATGVNALVNNTTASYNTADGLNALLSNTTGDSNTATGGFALFSNTTGSGNTATGFQALQNNTAAPENVAVGYRASASLNTNNGFSVAVGYQALANSTLGQNTAVGDNALFSNTNGNLNTAIGDKAGYNLTTGINNIDIGAFVEGVAGESNTIRIGESQSTTFIAGISGVNEGGTISTVYINSNGQLGTQPPPSSRRFKKEIRPMDKVSEAILALKPVTFQYKSNSSGTPQFGLIAEEVAQVNPDLVLRDSEGKVYTVRYEAVNAMLLNEFLKEHRKVQEQGATIVQQRQDFQAMATKLEATITQLQSTVAKQEATSAQQQKEIEDLTTSLKEQASQIQKVSDELEVSRRAPRMVASNQ
jgi:Skp family chaperone for outer membrane proteins